MTHQLDIYDFDGVCVGTHISTLEGIYEIMVELSLRGFELNWATWELSYM